MNKKINTTTYLSDVPGDKVFYVNNGPVLRNLGDMLALPLSNEQFSYHCNSSKNDFFNWITEVIGDRKLAHEISHVKSKDALLKKIDARVKELQKSTKK